MDHAQERQDRLTQLEGYLQIRLGDNPELRGTLIYNMLIDYACLRWNVSRRTAMDYAEVAIINLGLQERVKNVGAAVVYQTPP